MFPVVNGLRSVEFGTLGESRTNLVNLILYGQKRATAGLFSEYELENEPIEHVGELLAMVDNDGAQVGTLKVTRVEIARSADVPDEFALAEAEGDLSGDDFRESHSAYWTRVGEHVDSETQIVMIYFDLVPTS
jgi:uncharacterized protein YhfF